METSQIRGDNHQLLLQRWEKILKLSSKKKKNKLYVLKESTGTTEYEKYMWLLK